MTSTLRVSPAVPYARMLSVGSYRPERVVTNDEVCLRIDSTDQWIQERSGIRERRYAAVDESVCDMSVAAALIAIERAGLQPADVDVVILATVTHPYPTPSAAAEVAFRLGTNGAAAFDISAACAGFCYGIAMAQDFVRGGSARNVVVVGVEKLTDWIDLDDRSTAFIFADGAGAAVIGASDTPAISPVVWGSDGGQYQAIAMTQSLIDYRDNGGERFPTLSMEGQQVFRWAVSEIAKAAQRILDAAGISADELDAFIPHQANMRITDAMIRTLGLPSHVPVARDIATTGNTSAASIPLAMDRMISAGEVPSGGLALIIGFGAGLVYAGQVVQMP
ncbi:MAG: beta-ketoacyl-ACP synthase III [Candidatus Nanopelagicales bacterium]|jgi:3-oxoacyl-[acyl-carrier-protein] synthase III|nr:ketoacyl-ACP synthase III [Candidatus Nanopelagicales bacterium]